MIQKTPIWKRIELERLLQIHGLADKSADALANFSAQNQRADFSAEKSSAEYAFCKNPRIRSHNSLQTNMRGNPSAEGYAEYFSAAW